ncbi:hypothetical protein ACUIAK_18540 [Bacillus cytotoxicus]
MGKSVIVNNEQKRWSELLKEGDKLQVHMFIPEEYGVIPEFGELDVVFEDDHVLIVNKPEQMDTHPSEKKWDGNACKFNCFSFSNARFRNESAPYSSLR